MEFFGMGFGEIVLVLIIALIIWGPGKLPQISRTIGKTMRALRKASSDFTGAITREIDLQETKKNTSLPTPNKGDDKQNE